jgi:thymidylate synthase
MAAIDVIYKELAETIISDGFRYFDTTRNGVAMRQIPHYQIDYDMAQGFPLLTTKRIHWKMVAAELLWMISGSQNLLALHGENVHIWDKDAANFEGAEYPGHVGRIYGAQWRSWSPSIHSRDGLYVDQLDKAIQTLKHNPFNRRIIVNAWNPGELDLMALPPCHWAFEIIPYRELSQIKFCIKWHQRSVDTFLGLPFDIASYALLGSMIEKVTGYKFTRLIGDLSNVHFYEPHLGAVSTQLERDPTVYEAPELVLADRSNIDDFCMGDTYIRLYGHYASLPAELFTQTTK